MRSVHFFPRRRAYGLHGEVGGGQHQGGNDVECDVNGSVCVFNGTASCFHEKARTMTSTVLGEQNDVDDDIQ